MATILEGLNAISQAVGGTGEAESNLEALNQISEALGGSADATENAEAIANIAENASGGGGGGMVEVLPETTFTTEEMSGVNHWENEGLVIDSNKIEVTFDGTDYQMTAKESIGQKLYGDLTKEQMPDYTNYPFVIMSGDMGMAVYTQTAGTHTLKILGEAKTHKEATVSIGNYDYEHDGPAGIAAPNIKDGQFAAWVDINQGESVDIKVPLGASGAVIVLKTAGMNFQNPLGSATLDSTKTIATVTGKCELSVVNK